MSRFVTRFASPIAAVLLACLFVIAPVTQAQTTACEDGGVLLTHANGEICIPAGVERVVALEWTYAENLLALGIQPVGMADMDGYKTWVKIPLQLADDVVEVGSRQEPNLELIASLNPDLILAASMRVTSNYDELNEIAPTLVFDGYPTEGTHYDEMVTTFNTIAQAVNRVPQAEAVLSGLDSYFAASQRALAAAGRDGETFILAQTYPTGDVPTFRLFTDNALAVQVLHRVGWQNAWTDAPQYYGFSTVDFEAFSAIGDTNFFYIAQPEYAEVLTALPLWEGLPFVQADHAYGLGGDVWLFGGPLSMQLLVETIFDSLGIATPNVVSHVFGATEVPTAPERIVAADLGVFAPTIGTMAALGVKPTAAVISYIPDHLAPYLEGVEVISGEANYEAILALNPDLIITPGVDYNRENYDQLSLLAPTVAPRWYWQTKAQAVHYWQEVANVIGKAEEGAQLVADFEARITSLNEKFAVSMAGKPVSVFQVQGKGLGALYLQTGRLESALLDAVGIERPANQIYDENNPQWYLTVSAELLNEVDAWAIFVEVYADDPADIDSIKAELEGNALWNSLEAVQNNRVFYVQTDQWSGTDPLVANLILDTIDANLSAALAAE